MIVVAGTAPVLPDQREAAMAAISEMVAATLPEAGCISYVFSADLSDPCLFHIFEEWETQAHLEAHFATAHMAVFQSKLPHLLAGPASVKKYVVTDVAAL